MKRSDLLKNMIKNAKNDLKDIQQIKNKESQDELPVEEEKNLSKEEIRVKEKEPEKEKVLVEEKKEEVRIEEKKENPEKAREKEEPAEKKLEETEGREKPEAGKKTARGKKKVVAKEIPDRPVITPVSLGSKEFKKDYGLKYAYLGGSMFRGVSSIDLVVRLGKAGMMGFFGAGGLGFDEVEEAVEKIKKELNNGEPFGMNLLHYPQNKEYEEKIVDLYLRQEVRNVEASAFLTITPALVKYRARGLTRDNEGNIYAPNRVIAKISRPEVAMAFLSPPPERIIVKLQEEGKITSLEAELCRLIPVAEDLCVEADSGGHTDGGNLSVLMPGIMRLRDEMREKYGYGKKIRLGAAGGIGTPQAAVAAFLLGADFVLTGSINQCSVEGGTSAAAKELLQQMNIQDTEYVPAGDMFEMGARVQVLKKGLFFPSRALKLYDIYTHHNSLDEIDEVMKKRIEEKFFRMSFEEVFEKCRDFFSRQGTNEIEKAERNPKIKMALVFKWYFSYTNQLALKGDTENKVDYQIHCGPSLGAFNQWVKGTEMEAWNKRHVDAMGMAILEGASDILNRFYKNLTPGK